MCVQGGDGGGKGVGTVPVLSRAGLMASPLALQGGRAHRAVKELQAALWRGDLNRTSIHTQMTATEPCQSTTQTLLRGAPKDSVGWVLVL